MRTRSLATVCALCIVTTVVAGCSGTRPGERFVDKDAVSAVWSRDSRSLYYDKIAFFRYDIRTHRKQAYRLPGMQGLGFDVSPDGGTVVFKANERDVCLADLRTGTTQRVCQSARDLHTVYWVSQSRVLITEDTSGPESRICILDPTTGTVTPLLDRACAELAAADGSGFVYFDSKNRPRYRSLNTGTDKALAQCPRFGGDEDVYFIHLDKHRVIYNVWRSVYQYTEIVDLKTMHSRRIILPDAPVEMQLSPNLEKYWRTNGPLHSDWDSYKLCIVDVPPAIVKQLRAPVK